MSQDVLTTEEAKKANIDELLSKLSAGKGGFLPPKRKNDLCNTVLMKFRRKKLTRY